MPSATLSAGEGVSQNARRITWLLIGAAFAVPVVFAAVVGNNVASAVGYSIGRLGAALAVGVLLLAVATIKATPITKAWSEMALGALLLCWSLHGVYVDWRDISEMKGALTQMLSAVNDSKVAETGVAQATPLPASATDRTSAPGSVSAFVGGLTTLAASSTRDIAGIRKQMQSVDLSPILAPQTLTDLVSIGAAKERVSSYRKFVQADGARSAAFYADAEKHLRTAPAPEELRREMWTEFEKTASVVRPLYREYIATELELLTTADALLDFAALRQASLQVQGDQLLFADPDDLVLYQTLFRNIRAITAREETLITKLAVVEKATDKARTDLAAQLQRMP